MFVCLFCFVLLVCIFFFHFLITLYHKKGGLLGSLAILWWFIGYCMIGKKYCVISFLFAGTFICWYQEKGKPYCMHMGSIMRIYEMRWDKITIDDQVTLQFYLRPLISQFHLVILVKYRKLPKLDSIAKYHRPWTWWYDEVSKMIIRVNKCKLTCVGVHIGNKSKKALVLNISCRLPGLMSCSSWFCLYICDTDWCKQSDIMFVKPKNYCKFWCMNI